VERPEHFDKAKLRISFRVNATKISLDPAAVEMTTDSDLDQD
jgi:hypothetical protein